MAVDNKVKEVTETRTDFYKKEAEEVLISFDDDIEITGDETEIATKEEVKEMPVIMSIENLNKEYSKGNCI